MRSKIDETGEIAFKVDVAKARGDGGASALYGDDGCGLGHWGRRTCCWRRHDHWICLVAGIAVHGSVTFIWFEIAAALLGYFPSITGFIAVELHETFVAMPGRNIPNNSSEALQLEGSLLPFATRFPRSVEGTEASIDSTLVGFGA